MSPELTMVLRMLLASLLAGIIGYQREYEGKAAGFRTHILIGMGAALFTAASLFGFSSPVVASSIVTGVGFIGAGAILKTSEGMVIGLTTAASIWVTAAIGLAVGSGLYLVGIVTTVLALIVLIVHPRIAHLIYPSKDKK
jgi:putative Mg2+ transporter-C (MgtC) family protein